MEHRQSGESSRRLIGLSWEAGQMEMRKHLARAMEQLWKEMSPSTARTAYAKGERVLLVADARAGFARSWRLRLFDDGVGDAEIVKELPEDPRDLLELVNVLRRAPMSASVDSQLELSEATHGILLDVVAKGSDQEDGFSLTG